MLSTESHSGQRLVIYKNKHFIKFGRIVFISICPRHPLSAQHQCVAFHRGVFVLHPCVKYFSTSPSSPSLQITKVRKMVHG